MSGFDVEVADLGKHAASVEELRGRVSEARAAGAGVNLSGHAFGLMCSFLFGGVVAEEQSANAALGSMVGVLDTTSSGLTAMADDYRRADEGAASRMADLLKRMDR